MRELKFSYMYYSEKSDRWMDLRYTIEDIGAGEPFNDIGYLPSLKGFDLKHKRQYAGIKDKNGVEVYEGDIINSKRNCLFDDGRKHSEVKFRGGCFVSGGCSLSMIRESFDSIVVGNIYEHKHLLDNNTGG